MEGKETTGREQPVQRPCGGRKCGPCKEPEEDAGGLSPEKLERWWRKQALQAHQTFVLKKMGGHGKVPRGRSGAGMSRLAL